MGLQLLFAACLLGFSEDFLVLAVSCGKCR
jgi:hypothetical protein